MDESAFGGKPPGGEAIDPLDMANKPKRKPPARFAQKKQEEEEKKGADEDV